MLTVKVKKETEKEYRHWEIYHGDEYLGYFTKNRGFGNVVDENWNFTTKSSLLHFHAKTKKELLDTVDAQLNGDTITLKQYFGIQISLN